MADLFRTGVAALAPQAQTEWVRQQADDLRAANAALREQLGTLPAENEMLRDGEKSYQVEVERLREQLDAADKQVSELNDALYEQIPDGAGRDAVNTEIWKCHDILRAALGVVGPPPDEVAESAESADVRGGES